MNARPTMRDVARAAGVSVMTVSRVVNGGSSVQPETAARVERAIRQLGYQRDNVARQLRSKSRATQTIGLLVDDLANPFFASLARAVEDEARLRGYVVLIGSSNNDLGREREVIAAFCARHVDGLILVPVGGNHRFLKAQLTLGTKVVCVDRPADGLTVDTVVVDSRAGACRAVSYLLQAHQRIAYLGDRSDIWTQRERYAGYCDAFDALGLTPDPALVRHGLRSVAEAAEAMASLLRADRPPTAAFTGNDLITIGAIEGLRGNPGRITIIGFDDFALADQLDPPVSVTAQDPIALGATSAQLLFARIGGDTSAPREVILRTRLVIRNPVHIPSPDAA